MTDARATIFKAVAKSLPRRRPDAAAIAAEARELIGEPAAVRPALPLQNVTESFVQRVTNSKVVTTATRISSLSELPEAVARYLVGKNLPRCIALQPSPALIVLDWAAAGLLCENAIDNSVAVGIARWGIAETGSLVIHSAADAPILFNFLPAVHILAVHASAIVPYLEDYAEAARECGDPAPRNVCLITGASGTTDIEGNLVLGAHGPRELHIIVVDGASARGGEKAPA